MMSMTATAPPGSTAQIECADLVRIFAAEGVEVQALQGLNLRVERGELTAIVGASGSGKSTLLSILSGLDVPTAGSARVAGQDLLTMRGAARTRYRRSTVGFVWQQTARNLLPALTIADNIRLVLSLAHRPRRERSPRAAELLGLLGIADLGDRHPHQLSGGQQQRAALAVALANEPEVLFADEPTGELDEATSAEVLETMRDLNERLGVTVLIVTHDHSVSEHVRRTVQIRDGRTSTEVLRSTRVDDAGVSQQVAEEYAVLDRVGRLQLPADMVGALSLRDRVRLLLQDDHIRLSATDDGEEATSDTGNASDAGDASDASDARDDEARP